jgi:hypothetical protein
LCVLALLVPLALACKGDRETFICALTADRPHISSTARKRGIVQVTGKGWFKCDTAPADITLNVEIQRKTTIGWVQVGVPDRRTFVRPPAFKKSDEVVAAMNGCEPGSYRTALRATGHDDQGESKDSGWGYSDEVNPCTN